MLFVVIILLVLLMPTLFAIERKLNKANQQNEEIIALLKKLNEKDT